MLLFTICLNVAFSANQIEDSFLKFWPYTNCCSSLIVDVFTVIIVLVCCVVGDTI